MIAFLLEDTKKYLVGFCSACSPTWSSAFLWFCLYIAYKACELALGGTPAFL